METSETPRQKAIKLLEEAVYFVLLEHLSTHLSTYFNDSDGDDRVTEYKREDIPGFLLKNRVLSLLSTPIEQRDVFLDAFPNMAERPKGELCSLRSSTGAMYSRFDLVLPKGSKILHSDTGSIRIDTKRLSIELECHYDGTSVAIPNVFLSQYIGTNPKSAACRRLQISLKCSIKPISLLSSAGWEHYRWLDSFRDTLAKKVDFETFKNEIHWAHIEPLLYSMRRSIKSEPKKKEPIEANSETA